MITLLIPNGTQRLYIDHFYSEDEIQFYDSETQKVISKIKDQVRQDLQSELSFYGIEPNQKIDSAKAAQITEVVLKPKIAEAQDIFNLPNAEFMDLLKAQVQIEELEYQKRLLLSQ